MTHARLLLCLPLLCLMACGPETEPPSGQESEPPGSESSQTTPDGGDGVDAGPRPDAGGEPDAGPRPDAGGEPDAGPRPDAGPQQPPPPPPPPPVPEPERPFKLPPVQTSLQEYELSMPEETLQKFMTDVYTPEQDALFKADGTTYRVKVRLRGASARHFPKKSWNVSFEEGVRFEGRTSLNLVAEYADATLLAEKISYDLLAAMRVPAPNAKFARLRVNGVYQGVILDIEQVNKSFVKAHDFDDKDATVYRCGWKDCEFKTWKVGYQGKWSKRTNETQPDDKLWEMLGIINHTPEPQLVAALEKNLQLEHFLRSLVLDVLMSNHYVEDSESYFLYDRATAKWSYVPWDLNNVDARWWHQITVKDMETYSGNMVHPLFPFTITDPWVGKMYETRKLDTQSYPGYLPVFSNMGTRVVMNPVLRERMLARLDTAMNELFQTEVMNAYIDKLHALIDPHMRDDPYMSYDKFKAGRTYLKRYVKERRVFIQKELTRYAEQKPTLVFEAFDPREGWVEVGNRTSEAVSLRGMVLTTNLRVSLAQSSHTFTQVSNPVGAVLPDVTVAPGERVRLNAAELGIQLQPNGEIGLFDGKSVVGVKDLLFYGQLPSGKRYERGTRGWQVN